MVGVVVMRLGAKGVGGTFCRERVYSARQKIIGGEQKVQRLSRLVGQSIMKGYPH